MSRFQQKISPDQERGKSQIEWKKKKRQPVDSNTEMTEMWELSEKKFKAFIKIFEQ